MTVLSVYDLCLEDEDAKLGTEILTNRELC